MQHSDAVRERTENIGRSASEAASLWGRVGLAKLGPGFAAALLQDMVVPAFVLGADGRVLIWNKACERLTGIPAEDVLGTLDHWRGFYDAPRPCLADFIVLDRTDEVNRYYEHYAPTQEAPQSLSAENWCVMPRLGRRHYLAMDAMPIHDQAGRLIAVMETMRDLTEQKLAEDLRAAQARVVEMVTFNAALEEVLDRLIRLIEGQIDGVSGSILLLDDDGQHLRHCTSPNLPEAYTRAIDGTQIGAMVGSCGTAAYLRMPVLVADVLSDPRWESFRELIRPFGYRACWSIPIFSNAGAVIGTFAFYSKAARQPTQFERRLIEMTAHVAGIAIERKRSEEKIHFMAHHDPLTSLPNRARLMERLNQAIDEARDNGGAVALTFLDLDNFKLVNDSLGHNAGDELLRITASRLTSALSDKDHVVRLGGDEFIVVQSHAREDADARIHAVQRLRACVCEPVLLDGLECRVTASLGVACFPKDADGAEGLLACADAAMYAAKNLGRDNLQVYSPDMQSESAGELLYLEELRRALARSEFSLLYQPQIDVRSGTICAVEALIRWNHPTRGLISPAEFIPLAEKSGLIVAIGEWVLETACRQNKLWQDAGLPPLIVSVNMSARQFREKTLVDRVQQALAESGLDARYLELEITESLLMLDPEAALARMNELQALGVRFAIDDFGTGYSNLSSLKQFPIACLKIDRSFLQNLPDNLEDKMITAAVISLGQSLNMRVVAEGVETAKQFSFLVERNCDRVQGYLFSRPVSAIEIQVMMEGQGVEPMVA